ncbi:hypothetical protein KP509_37G013800 [Ceratopteris richardii]|nr:hypothetical protein KP509_37G013800 [Ceratopteris richardii]
MLQSHMSRGDFLESDTSKGGPQSQDRKFKGETDSNEDVESEVHLEGYDGDLSRCLSGRKASDVRLAAIALGTQSCGGLGKLSIRDGSATGFKLSLTDVGLSAIGSWCSGLRVLSLWNCPYITDQGLASIGNGCHILEKVDLYKCPLVGDSGLQVIAKRCPRLSYLNLDECEKISDVALVAVAEHCANLTILTLQNCPQVSDYGITKVVCNLKMLKKLKLSGLRLTGRSLESIGAQEGDLSWLTLQNLDQVGPDGFVCITHPRGLHKLKHLHIADCRNFTDFSLSMVAKCCGNLKHFSLHKCDLVSDKGLILFMKSVPSLQVLHLEKCNMISGTGIVSALSVRGKELREFQIKKCAGVHEVQAICPPIPDGSALQSICITDCPDVGDLLVALVGLLCKEAVSIDFSGLQNITDDGLLAFLCGGGSKLTSLKLSGCCKISDRALCVIVQEGGQTIRNLALDGCKNLSDKSLKAISSNCPFLEDLDISDCAITNAGLEDWVSSNGKMLSSLNLSGCVGVTDRSLSSILKNCDHLQDLNLKNCKGISERAASAFQSRKLNCMVLY